jgi:hypothetical protein
MAWNMTADFIETCSCNMLCPCWYGVRELMVMDQGWCASVWLLRVQHGNAEADSYSGTEWHLDCHRCRVWPGALAAADQRRGTTDHDAAHRVYDGVAV